MSAPFTAQYDGRCAECGDDIYADADKIVMTDDGAVHAECAVTDTTVTFPL